LIIEFTVSTCHLWPYARFSRANLSHITRRHRPFGGLSDGRPRAAGLIRPHAVRPHRLVQPLRVEVRVGQEHVDPRTPRRPAEGPAELHQVGGRPTPVERREVHVAGAVGQEDGLREMRVNPVSAGFPVSLTLREVAADVARIQAHAVDRRQADAPLPHPDLERQLEHGVEHPTAGGRGQEPLGGLLEGGEVGDGLHADLVAEVGVVGEVRSQPAVVEAREPLEHHARQVLGLGKLLGAELVAVRGKGPAVRLESELEHASRGFAGLHTS
jgi:hypothetical protein